MYSVRNSLAVNVCRFSTLQDINLQLLEDVQLGWNTHLHMTMFSLAEELQHFYSTAKGKHDTQTHCAAANELSLK